MSISLYGQLNVTALSRPDLYVQIAPPQPLLNGIPTNLAGVVGTAAWGPVNSPVTFTGVYDGSQYFGPLNNRLYDLMTAVTAAVFQGGVGNYVGIRVTDGTDTKATVTAGSNGSMQFWQAVALAINTGNGTPRGPSNIITAVGTLNSLLVTAKYTGSLGAKVQISVTSGAAANSFRIVVMIPGSTPEIFDSLGAVYSGAPVAANGWFTSTANPVAATTLVIAGTSISFVASNPTGNQVLIGATNAATFTNLLNFLNLSADVNLVKATYQLINTGAINPVTGLVAANPVIVMAAVAAGVAGNSLTLTQTVTGGSVSGATFANGSATMVAPTLANVTMTGGADGSNPTNITSSTMLGVDTVPRTGMYALRKTGVSIAALADMTDSTSWATQNTFGISESIYMVTATPSGDTIANAVTTKINAGIDTEWLKIMFGDWVTFQDTFNGLQRTISPMGFALGNLANLSPQYSTLNKQIYGVVSTQKSAANQVYADSDIATLAINGFDVICNPVPRGNIFGMRTGRNAASKVATHGDNYTRMTNYLATTLNQGMGLFVGELQSQQVNDLTRRKIVATITAYLGNLQAPGGDTTQALIDDFQVVDDLSNNSPFSIAAGYNFCSVKVIYLAVIEYLVINLEGGQTVQITRASTLPRTS